MATRLFLLISFLFTAGTIFGDCCQEQESPFFGWIQYDDMANADFQGKERRHQHLKYRIGKINFGSVLCYNPKCKEGLAAMCSYTSERLDWNNNPNFSKKNFNTLSLSLSAFSMRLCDWNWKANVTFNQNTDHLTDWERYSTWDLLLWGRHDWKKNVGLHMGFYAITGMHLDRVYPIFGFDWHCYNNIKVNLVFPVDMSVIWEYSKCLSISGSVHFFESRQRVGKHEPLSMAIWNFKTWGTELGLNYYLTEIFQANIHAGYAFGGKVKVANRNYDNPHHFKFKSAPYVGGELKISY